MRRTACRQAPTPHVIRSDGTSWAETSRRCGGFAPMTHSAAARSARLLSTGRRLARSRPVQSGRLLARLILDMMDRMQLETVESFLDHIERLTVEPPDRLDHLGEVVLGLIPGHDEIVAFADKDVGAQVDQVVFDRAAVVRVDRERPADEVGRSGL